jgi:hypothetical protein
MFRKLVSCLEAAPRVVGIGRMTDALAVEWMFDSEVLAPRRAALVRAIPFTEASFLA